MDLFAKIIALVMLLIFAGPTVIFWGGMIIMSLKKDPSDKKNTPTSDSVTVSQLANTSKTEEQKQREYLEIKNKYFELKKQYDNNTKIVNSYREEYTSYKFKSSLICFALYIIVALLLSIDYPDFFSGWFILYFLLCIIIYAFVIWVGGTDYRNCSKRQEEMQLQLSTAEKAYNKIKNLIIEIDPKQESQKTTPEKSEIQELSSNTDIIPSLPPKETKNIVTPAEPVSFDSPPPTEQPELRCDSFGNIKPNTSEPPKNSKIPVLIYGTILVAFLIGIIVFIITQIETPEPPEPHVHEYVNGQCSCLSFDESYCEPIYQEILDIMETMNTPIEDLVTIQSKLELLPIEYMGVKSITAQCYVLYRQCSIIRNESLQKNPDYEKMQSAFYTLLDKKDLGSYDSWNMYNILYSFLDKDLYATGEELWAILYGNWESSSGYIFSFDGEYVSTNIKHPLSNNADYYFYSDGYEMYVSSSDNNTVFKFFSLNYLTSDKMRIRIHSSKSYITFTRK